MKKLTCALLAVTMLSVSLISCELKEDDNIKANSTDAVTVKETMPWEGPSLSEEDAAIRAVSDPAFMHEYGFDDLSYFTATIDKDLSDIVIRYYLTVAGVQTNEFYTVEMTRELEIKELRDWHKGEYSKYISEDFIQKVNEAKKKIADQVAVYVEEGHYYFTENDGHLCLCVELIVDIDPPESQSGEYIEGGCGIDHEHVFFSEKVCPLK